MAACRPTNHSSSATPERNRWTGPLIPRCARQIPLSLCLHNSRVLTSNCVTGTTTTFSQASSINGNESYASTGPRKPFAGDLRVRVYPRSREPSSFSMREESPFLPLLAIVGPTASGKSALGVALAERFGGEVVACDSTQLYRGFTIGTAKPSLAERRGIPHHLIDVLGPEESATAGGYRQLALEILDELRTRKRLPILTVGTGLYLRALLEGLADVPQRSEELRERLRASIEEHPPGHLHRILKRLDPEAAQKIAPADEQKIIRAVEICILAKKP